MPVYEYTCEACGAAFDHLVKSVHSTDKPVCPECRSKRVTRRYSTFAARQGTRSAAPPAGPCSGCADGACPMRTPE
jgi:putative FmdB family regulatory protein